MATKLHSSPALLPKQLTALVALILIVLLIGTAGFVLSEGSPISGAAVMTLQSLGFQNHAELSATGKALNTFLSAIGVIVIWFSIWTAFGLAVEGKFGEYFKEAKMASQINSMRNHYIICGAGRVGKHVGLRLKQRGETVLFIEKDRDTVNKLLADGYTVLESGQIDEQILRQANLHNAKGVIASLGDDSKNLLLIMTAREIAPHVKIGVRVNDHKLIQKMRHAGARYIIIPEAVGGVKLADAMLGNPSHDVL
jgi:voltage-gated potassium channel